LINCIEYWDQLHALIDDKLFITNYASRIT